MRMIMYEKILSATIVTMTLAQLPARADLPSIDQALKKDALAPRGQWYHAEVPATLDLAERARLAINVLTRNVEPKMFYGVYQGLHSNPMQACCLTWNITPKNLRALPGLRTMCGSDQNLDIEYNMMRAMMREIRDNGQMYYPFAGGGAPKGTSYPHINGLTVLAMEYFYLRDGHRAWLDWMGLLSNGLKKIAVHRENRAYYPPECGYSPDGDWQWTLRGNALTEYTPPDEPVADHQGLEGAVKSDQVRPLRALVTNYLLNHDDSSIQTARQIASFVLKPSMWVDTSAEGYCGYEHGIFNGHFHNNTLALLALLDFAQATQNDQIKQFVREAYDHARRFGVARLGWYPGWITPDKLDRPANCASISETCGLADMLMLAVKLSDAGLGDYWDDVDAIIRNQLAEQQYVDRAVLEKCLITPADDQNVTYAYKPVSNEDLTIEGVDKRGELIDRFLGGFTSGSEPAMMSAGMAGCCTANGSLSLYYAWHGITRFDDGVATVNLLLNRASDWLDIDSYLPYEGKIILRNKKAHTVMVRVPGWLRPEVIKAYVDEKPVSSVQAGRYLVFENLNKTAQIRLEFLMPETTEKYTIYGAQYTLTFRGSTVVDISPNTSQSNLGSVPLYQRQNLKATTCPMKKIRRFVPEKVLALQ